MPHNRKRNGSPQSAEAGWRLERQPREGAHHPKGGHGAPNPPAQPTQSPRRREWRQDSRNALLTQRHKGMGSPQAESNRPTHKQPNAHMTTHAMNTHRRGVGVNQQAGPHGWQNPDGRVHARHVWRLCSTGVCVRYSSMIRRGEAFFSSALVGFMVMSFTTVVCTFDS